ncbi:MAG: hypothetical protein WCG06_03990, partial [Candidatus Omnitrophota bacterium]
MLIRTLSANIRRSKAVQGLGDVDEIFALDGAPRDQKIRLGEALRRLDETHQRRSWELPGLTSEEDIHKGFVRYWLFSRFLGFLRRGNDDQRLRDKQQAMIDFNEALRTVEASAASDDDRALLVMIRSRSQLIVSGAGFVERLEAVPQLAALTIPLIMVADITGVSALAMFLQRRMKLMIASGLSHMLLGAVATSPAGICLIAGFFVLWALVRHVLMPYWSGQAVNVYRAAILSLISGGVAGLFFLFGWSDGEFDITAIGSMFNFKVGGHMVDVSLGGWISSGITNTFLTLPAKVTEKKNEILARRFNQELQTMCSAVGLPELTRIDDASLRDYLVALRRLTDDGQQSAALVLLRRNLILGFFDLSDAKQQTFLRQLDDFERTLRLSASASALSLIAAPLAIGSAYQSRDQMIAQIYAQAYQETLADGRFWGAWLKGTWGMWFITHEIALVVGLSKVVDYLLTQLGLGGLVGGKAFHLTHSIVTTVEGDKNAGSQMDQGGLLGLANNLLGQAQAGAANLPYLGEAAFQASHLKMRFENPERFRVVEDQRHLSRQLQRTQTRLGDRLDARLSAQLEQAASQSTPAQLERMIIDEAPGLSQGEARELTDQLSAYQRAKAQAAIYELKDQIKQARRAKDAAQAELLEAERNLLQIELGAGGTAVAAESARQTLLALTDPPSSESIDAFLAKVKEDIRQTGKVSSREDLRQTILSDTGLRESLKAQPGVVDLFSDTLVHLSAVFRAALASDRQLREARLCLELAKKAKGVEGLDAQIRILRASLKREDLERAQDQEPALKQALIDE